MIFFYICQPSPEYWVHPLLPSVLYCIFGLMMQKFVSVGERSGLQGDQFSTQTPLISYTGRVNTVVAINIRKLLHL